MKRDYSHIDPKIQPLVQALDAVPGIQTGLSSGGQIWPFCIPFVHVCCSLVTAKMIDGKLRQAHHAGLLNYWWAIDARFLADETLAFRIRSRSFRFLEFLAGRRKVNRDLMVLAEVFNDLRGQDQNIVENVKHDSEADGRQERPQPSSHAGLVAPRIGGSAIRTGAFEVRRYFAPTDAAGHQISHVQSFRFLKVGWTLARLFVAVVFVATTVSACGPSREIQHDGSGSDEMLKSPCACLPVPYEAPSFTWGKA